MQNVSLCHGSTDGCHLAMTTLLSVVDGDAGGGDDNTADNDYKRYDDDRQICATECVLDTEDEVRNRVRTNICLPCIVKPI